MVSFEQATFLEREHMEYDTMETAAIEEQKFTHTPNAYLALWRQDGCHQSPYDDATRMVHLLACPAYTQDEIVTIFRDLLQQLGQSHNAALRWEMTHVIHRTSVLRKIVLPITFMSDYLRIASAARAEQADRYDYVFVGFERTLCDQLERGNRRTLTIMIRRGLDDLRAGYENFGGKKCLTETQARLDAFNAELYPKLKKVEARMRKKIAELEQERKSARKRLDSLALDDHMREDITTKLLALDDDIRDREAEIAEAFPHYFTSLRKSIAEVVGVVKRLSTLELQIHRHEALLAKYASS